MKMFNVNFRVIASFVLAIFLTTLSVILIAWACDNKKSTVSYLENEITQQERKISELEEKGYMGSISEGGWWGMGIGAGVGLAEAAATGPLAPVTAVPLVAKGAVLGGLGGAGYGAVSHYNNLSAARDELESLKSQLVTAKWEYEECLNPPAKYTFTDPNSGYVYEFCATMYGSDSAAYTEYMEFLANRGY